MENSSVSAIPAASYTDSSIISRSYSKYTTSFTLSAILTKVPRLQAQAQPITRSLLRIDLSIVLDFRWEGKIYRTVWTLFILFHDSFVLRQRYVEAEHIVTITVPMFEPVPPNYYISADSDTWLHSETRLPISFKHLILPEKFPPPTLPLGLQPLPLSVMHNKDREAIYSNTTQTFNKVQTQVFQFALLKLWTAREQCARSRIKRWLTRALPSCSASFAV